MKTGTGGDGRSKTLTGHSDWSDAHQRTGISNRRCPMDGAKRRLVRAMIGSGQGTLMSANKLQLLANGGNIDLPPCCSAASSLLPRHSGREDEDVDRQTAHAFTPDCGAARKVAEATESERIKGELVSYYVQKYGASGQWSPLTTRISMGPTQDPSQPNRHGQDATTPTRHATPRRNPAA
nr:unnamed protein product [Digitaria exilis]